MTLPVQNELGDLLRAAQAGCQEAAKTLCERWRGPVLKVIRQRLSRRVRRLFDSEDFLQDAFLEGLAHAFEEDFSPQAFCAYLQKIAENKVRDAERKYVLSQKSSIAHDVPINHAKDMPGREDHGLFDQTLADQDDEYRNEIGRLIKNLPTRDRMLIELRLTGTMPKEIADILKISERQVYHAIDRIKSTWRRRAGGGVIHNA